MAEREVWQPQPGSQALFIACPIREVLYEGTRGPGKTTALLMDFAQHVGPREWGGRRGYGEHWRGILFRRTYKQLDDVVAKSKLLYRALFGNAARFNASDYVWTFPWGEQLLLRYMDVPEDYWNYHGHEYPWIGFEELTNWPTLDCYFTMHSTNRSSYQPPAGGDQIPLKIRSTANPYGVGHNAVKMYFIDPAPPGVPIANEQGQLRVRIRGSWLENRALLEATPDYPQTLLKDRNPNRRRAWFAGDWDIVAGGMFDDLWRRDVHILSGDQMWHPKDTPPSWTIDRAYDWGSSKPFSLGWWAESDGTRAPNGRYYPPGTLIRIAEWYGWDGETPNVGVNMADTDIAKRAAEIEEALGIRHRVQPGPADPQIFAARPGKPSIHEEMAQYGITFVEADKSPGSRVTGWKLIRDRLSASTRWPMEHPGLFVFETCRQFIRTFPVLPRDERNTDDVDTEAEDHIGDETRYRVLHTSMRAGTQRLKV